MTCRKIAFYNGTNYYGGPEKNIIRFIEWLNETGNEILFIGSPGTPVSMAAKKKGITVIQAKEKTKIFSPGRIYRLSRLLKENKIGLLVFGRPQDVITLSLTKLLFYRRLILVFFQQTTSAPKPHAFLRGLIVKTFDAWITPSESVRKENLKVRHCPPGKLHVIAPCIDSEFYKNDTLTKSKSRVLLKLPESSKILGSFGKYGVMQKQDFLVRTMQLLHRHNFDVDLLIMGNAMNEEEKDYYNFITELVRECNLERYVYFRPFSEKLITFYRAIDFFLVNTVTQPYDLALVKAMAAGVPVLARYTGQHEEVLAKGNNGLLYKADNLEDITAKIIHLITQPKLVNYIKNEALMQVRRLYDRREACRKMENLFNELLEDQ